MKLDYPIAVRELILQLKRLPGVGPKSAERMALWLLQREPEALTDMARVMRAVEGEIVTCEDCGFFATSQGCAICGDEERDRSVMCVVEQATDILPIERTGAFRGQYHALGGRLEPLDNVGPDELRMTQLQRRVEEGEFEEIVLALGSDVAGEATANYLLEMFAGTGVRLTKLAQGMPVGGGLDTADTLTLHRAFENRR